MRFDSRIKEYRTAAASFRAQVFLGRDGSGKAVRKDLYGETREEVQTKLDVLEGRLKHGKVEPSKERLAVFLREWVESRRPDGLEDPKAEIKLSTWIDYESKLRVHIEKSTFGMMPIGEIRARHVEDFVGALKKESMWVALGVFRFLSHGFDRAVVREMIEANPCAPLTAPIPPKVKHKTWTMEEARTFLECGEKGSYWFPLFALAIDTGLRHGELLALHWDAIDFEARSLEVRTTYVERQVRYRDGSKKWFKGLTSPKTEESKGTVTLSPRTIRILKQHRINALASGLLKFPQVFPTHKGTYHSQSNVRRAFRRLLKVLDLPVPRVHDLRHTCATLMAEDGAQASEISTRLRHADGGQLALRTYIEAATKKMEQAGADRMAKLLAD